MNGYKIFNFKIILTENEDSYFHCQLNDNKKIEISLWSFYAFIIKSDKALEKLSEQFDEWETLTEELLTLSFDFEKYLSEYINQFDDDQMEFFVFI